MCVCVCVCVCVHHTVDEEPPCADAGGGGIAHYGNLDKLRGELDYKKKTQSQSVSSHWEKANSNANSSLHCQCGGVRSLSLSLSLSLCLSLSVSLSLSLSLSIYMSDAVLSSVRWWEWGPQLSPMSELICTSPGLLGYSHHGEQRENHHTRRHVPKS